MLKISLKNSPSAMLCFRQQIIVKLEGYFGYIENNPDF